MKKESSSGIDMTWEAVIAFTISAIITIFCMEQMKLYPAAKTYWWLSFMLVNIAYLVHGMNKGWAKGDPANGLVIASGPIAFYSWTVIAIWRKYGPKKEQESRK